MATNNDARSAGLPTEPVNPYAASLTDVPMQAVVSGERAAARNYRVRMDWADRCRFLRAVGLLRLAVVAGAILVFIAFYGLGTGILAALKVGDLGSWFVAVRGVDTILRLLQVGASMYLFWSQWRYAEAIARTASGQTASMGEWSRMQLRLAWLAVAMIAINFAPLLWDWLVDQWMSSARFGL